MRGDASAAARLAAAAAGEEQRPVTWLLVVAGAMIGAPVRYLTGLAIARHRDPVFPWGTLTVNVVGCLLLGTVTGAVTHGAASGETMAFLGIGFCGALTTYSTFSYETMRLAETGARLLALANLTVSVVAGVGALLLGSAAAGAIWAPG